MKKFISFIAIGLIPFMGISAQSENSKNYLPEQGDIAIGVNVKPVFKYMGNIFNGNTNNEMDYLGGEPVTTSEFNNNILPDVSLMGKYMLSENWGVRANVGMMFGTDKDRRYVQDDKALLLNPFDETKLIDQRNVSKNGLSLMLGAEYRTGSDRIQGVFSAGVLFGTISQKTTYQYANAVTSVNQQPSSAWSSGAYRPLTVKADNGVFYGVTGSAGVEWFVAPKVSLGAEVNLSLYGINSGQQYTESEGYNSSTKKVEVRTDLTSPGDGKVRFGTENLGGSFYMAFYF
jgi:hypothetical protein